MSLNVDYAAGDAKMRSKYYYTMNGNYVTNVNQNNQEKIQLNQQEGDTFISSLTGAVGSGNTCTDGIDDGKIGLGGVVANVAQGAVRTIPNMIKGAFTNSEGKFSLAKTALTIGIGAACVAFPAVGLALCAVGMGAGVIRAGSNVIKAFNADTDAEAKAAWENVGSGATTAALSYVGAKASYNAVEASAGKASVLKGAKLLEYAKENGVKQTVVDLAKDCVTSTKNNGHAILDKISISSQARELNKLEGIKPDKLTEAQAKKLNELKANSEVQTKAAELKTASETKAAAKAEVAENIKSAKAQVKNAKAELKNAKPNYDKALSEYEHIETWTEAKYEAAQNLKDAQSALDAAPENLANAKAALSKAKSQTTFGKLVTKAKSITKKAPTKADLTSGIKNLRSKANSSSLLKSIESLGAKGQAVAKAIMNKDIPADSIIAQFKYETVGQVIEILAGERSADSSL